MEYVIDSNGLKFITNGWMRFGDFIGEVINFFSEHQINSKEYHIGGEYCTLDDTEEDANRMQLGRYLVADFQGYICQKNVHLGIKQDKYKPTKREFTFLGVDLTEACYIQSIDCDSFGFIEIPNK